MTPVSQLQWWSCRNLSLRQHSLAMTPRKPGRLWPHSRSSWQRASTSYELAPTRSYRLTSNPLHTRNVPWPVLEHIRRHRCYLKTPWDCRLGPALSGPMANLLAAMACGTLLELLNLDPIGLLQTSLLLELARLFQLVQFLLFLLPAHSQYVGYLMLFIGVLRFCCRIQTAMFGEEQFHIIKLHLWLSLEDLRRLVHGSSWFNHMGANCSALGHYIVGEAWPHGGGHSVELQIALGTGKYDCPLFLIHATAL